MHDSFAPYEEKEGAVIAYAIFSFFAGCLCLCIGLLVFPFWGGVSFAILAPVPLTLTFAALRVQGRNSSIGPSGKSTSLKKIEPAQVRDPDAIRSGTTRRAEAQKGQKTE